MYDVDIVWFVYNLMNLQPIYITVSSLRKLDNWSYDAVKHNTILETDTYFSPVLDN